MIDLEFLKAVATERGVSELELETLSLAIEGKSTKAIAEQLEVRDDTVRKRLSDVYRKFQVPGIGPVKLNNLQRMLVTLSQEQQARSAAAVSSQEARIEKKEPDWGDAPEIKSESFYGRQKELADLEKWIIKDKCQLVAILGMSGIGKTALSVTLAKKLQDKFERVFWRSLRYDPDIDKLLIELITYISSEDIPENIKDIDDKISLIVNLFKKYRCLVVLDNLETILQDKELAGLYLKEYKNYGLLLERLGRERHSSCLVITSREEPQEISQLKIDGLLVRSLQLDGLGKDAEEILKHEGLSGKEEWTRLINLYKGNPLFLKFVGRSIKEILDGDVSKFVKQSFSAFIMDISIFISEQFNRLDPLEQQIIYWLALAPNAVALDELNPLSEPDLLNALQSLIRRSFIEKEGANFSLQFVVKEYALKQLADDFYQEIEQFSSLENLRYIGNYSIANSSEQARINDNKNRFILLFKKRVEKDKKQSKIESQIQEIMKEAGVESVGYVKENVETLLKAISSPKF